MDQRYILVLGGSGYVGSRLVLSLLEKRFLVRATSRSISRLKKRPWANHPGLQLAEADVFDENSLANACSGAVVAYYFVQCIDQGYRRLAKLNRRAAENFVQAAEKAGVERIVYLGCPGESGQVSSRLAQSKIEVEQVLKSGKIPVTVFRAGLILGSGNPAFEVLRHAADRMPVMIAPAWFRVECQPVSIRDVVQCLVRCLEIPETVSEGFDLGGNEVLKYEKLLQIYSEEAGLQKRWMIPFRLPGAWIHSRILSALLPMDWSLIHPILEAFNDKTLCRDTKISNWIPLEYPWPRDIVKTMLYQRAETIERNLPADSLPLEWSLQGDAEWSGGTVYRYRDTATVAATPEDAWRVLSRMGGRSGWYHGNWFLSLRGAVDRLLGGSGMKPGRKNDFSLKAGEPIDCWRIKIAEPLRRLLLVSELKMPGRCYWDFKINSVDSEKIELSQEMIFIPRGFPGFLYWRIFNAFRKRFFTGTALAIAQRTSLKII